MSRPEFTAPDFVLESEPEDIQERMMEQLPSDISDMDGDFPYDFTMPSAIEISKAIEYSLVRGIMAAFPEYAWDDWLDLHGVQAHTTRNEATYATGIIEVEAEYGVFIPAGTIFAVPATDANEVIEFTTSEAVTYEAHETKQIPVTASEAGAIGNVPANTITIMAQPPVNGGIISITNPEATSGGYEREKDADYYERIHAENISSGSYVGNDADFVKWAKQVPGVGECIVLPAEEAGGPGYVKLVLVDSNGSPASEELIQAVYEHILSPEDRSKRLLAAGSAHLTIAAAETKTVNYTCTGLVLDGITLEALVDEFRAQVSASYAAAKESGVLRYNTYRAILSNIAGVIDFSTFLMNDEAQNIVLSTAEYAATGTVSFAVAEGG